MNNAYYFLIHFRPLTLLQAQIPSIVKAIHKQLREKSFKTRQVIRQVSWNLAVDSGHQGCLSSIWVSRLMKHQLLK